MNVILADGKTKERKALGRLLRQDSELNLVAETSETDGLLTQTHALLPDLVVLEWGLPGLESADLIQALSDLGPLRVVAFSDQLEARHKALAAGVNGFVIKNETVDELLKTVRAVGGLSPYIVS